MRKKPKQNNTLEKHLPISEVYESMIVTTLQPLKLAFPIGKC